MTTPHTPGLWCISKLATPNYAPEFGIYQDGAQRDLARVTGENSAADAQLIAAAPILLIESIALVKQLKPMAIHPSHYADLEAAIAKAINKTAS